MINDQPTLCILASYIFSTQSVYQQFSLLFIHVHQFIINNMYNIPFIIIRIYVVRSCSCTSIL